MMQNLPIYRNDHAVYQSLIGRQLLCSGNIWKLYFKLWGVNFHTLISIRLSCIPCPNSIMWGKYHLKPMSVKLMISIFLSDWFSPYIPHQGNPTDCTFSQRLSWTIKLIRSEESGKEKEYQRASKTFLVSLS